MPRKFTCKILDLVDEGMLDPKWLAEALLQWMSEQEVHEFYNIHLADYDNEESDNEESDDE
jgi:hypothetical protein